MSFSRKEAKQILDLCKSQLAESKFEVDFAEDSYNKLNVALLKAATRRVAKPFEKSEEFVKLFPDIMGDIDVEQVKVDSTLWPSLDKPKILLGDIQFTSHDWARLALEIIQECEVLNSTNLRCVAARNTLVEGLRPSLTLLSETGLENPENFIKSVHEFMGQLFQEDPEAFGVLHIFLRITQKICASKDSGSDEKRHLLSAAGDALSYALCLDGCLSVGDQAKDNQELVTQYNMLIVSTLVEMPIYDKQDLKQYFGSIKQDETVFEQHLAQLKRAALVPPAPGVAYQFATLRLDTGEGGPLTPAFNSALSSSDAGAARPRRPLDSKSIGPKL